MIVIFPLMVDTPTAYHWLDIHQRVASAAKEFSLDVIDLLETFQAAGFRHVRADDVHPNEAGHRLAAEQIAAWLTRERRF